MATQETKHTEGPWEAGRTYRRSAHDFYAIVFAQTKTGRFQTPRPAESIGVSKEEAEANARLIAAAPELLAAAKQVLEVWGRLPRTAGDKETRDAGTALEAAIAKATNQQ